MYRYATIKFSLSGLEAVMVDLTKIISLGTNKDSFKIWVELNNGNQRTLDCQTKEDKEICFSKLQKLLEEIAEDTSQYITKGCSNCNIYLNGKQ